ncbi:TPA: hypothetical protein N0F65_005752 [Lagenidium giganteum]|uniref:Uncharacterized protein n=1 Tax=Lagenidium giganteum TaxID=4803 RepID=A0AAV2YXQ2_9STRA|nr:TPA: hypothetical protein N0F65_005752 [Lagenidium giganteum]
MQSRTRDRCDRSDVIWLTEGYAFVECTVIDDHTLEVSYGNHMECMSEERAQHFMLELGGILIRWEQMVIPPHLING